MSNKTFKKGDVVRRTGPDFMRVVQGADYTVSMQRDLRNVYLVGIDNAYDPDQFTLVRSADDYVEVPLADLKVGDEIRTEFTLQGNTNINFGFVTNVYYGNVNVRIKLGHTSLTFREGTPSKFFRKDKADPNAEKKVEIQSKIAEAEAILAKARKELESL